MSDFPVTVSAIAVKISWVVGRGAKGYGLALKGAIWTRVVLGGREGSASLKRSSVADRDACRGGRRGHLNTWAADYPGEMSRFDCFTAACPYQRVKHAKDDKTPDASSISRRFPHNFAVLSSELGWYNVAPEGRTARSLLQREKIFHLLSTS